MESDILCPEVTITVTSREPQTRVLDTSLPALSGQRFVDTRGTNEGVREEDDDEEDTVIDFQDNRDKGLPTYPRTTQRQSPPGIPLNSTRTETQRVVRLTFFINQVYIFSV